MSSLHLFGLNDPLLDPPSGGPAHAGSGPTIVVPRSVRYDLILTCTTPLSHHDAGVQDDSNRSMFNRQKQLLAGGAGGRLPTQAEVDAVCAANPVPADLSPLFEGVSFAEYVGAALVRLFIEMYGSAGGGDGTGVFSGVERYSRLEARARQSAIHAPTLRAWWDALCASLNVPIHASKYDRPVLQLLQLPATVQQLTLAALQRDYRTIVMLGRAWQQEGKGQWDSEDQTRLFPDWATLAFAADDIAPHAEGARVVEVPTLSGNSARHQVVREPGWRHLCRTLGISATTPGQGELPPGVEAVFYNGGNISAGAKQPSGAFDLAQRIRQTHPLLDLLGGVTDSFDLGQSRLRVAAHLVCRENAGALVGTPAEALPAAGVSVFDMLDEVTLTRQATDRGVGQMIFTFEALCPGTPVLVRLDLDPFSAPMTHGALLAAITEYVDGTATVGGQSARGFGWMDADLVGVPDGVDVAELVGGYERYLSDNRDALLAGMRDGTMGTGRPVIS